VIADAMETTAPMSVGRSATHSPIARICRVQRIALGRAVQAHGQHRACFSISSKRAVLCRGAAAFPMGLLRPVRIVMFYNYWRRRQLTVTVVIARSAATKSIDRPSSGRQSDCFASLAYDGVRSWTRPHLRRAHLQQFAPNGGHAALCHPHRPRKSPQHLCTSMTTRSACRAAEPQKCAPSASGSSRAVSNSARWRK